MSKFSGKCDLCDTLEIHRYTDEELKNNINIYVGKSNTPLNITKKEDLIPYYPYIIGCSFFSNDNKKSVIYLSSRSFVDIEEEDVLKFYLNQILKIYNRCKRKKEEFNREDVIKRVCWSDSNIEQITELVNRVSLHGKKTTIDGIHLKSKNYYRKQLVEEMINNGIDPAAYGYERFVENKKEK